MVGDAQRGAPAAAPRERRARARNTATSTTRVGEARGLDLVGLAAEEHVVVVHPRAAAGGVGDDRVHVVDGKGRQVSAGELPGPVGLAGVQGERSAATLTGGEITSRPRCARGRAASPSRCPDRAPAARSRRAARRGPVAAPRRDESAATDAAPGGLLGQQRRASPGARRAARAGTAAAGPVAWRRRPGERRAETAPGTEASSGRAGAGGGRTGRGDVAARSRRGTS